MESVFINKNKPKNVMSNLTYSEHKVYEAHSVRQSGLMEYVDLDSFNKFKMTLFRIANENLSAKDAEKISVAVLKEVLGDDPI